MILMGKTLKEILKNLPPSFLIALQTKKEPQSFEAYIGNNKCRIVWSPDKPNEFKVECLNQIN